MDARTFFKYDKKTFDREKIDIFNQLNNSRDHSKDHSQTSKELMINTLKQEFSIPGEKIIILEKQKELEMQIEIERKKKEKERELKETERREVERKIKREIREIEKEKKMKEKEEQEREEKEQLYNYLLEKISNLNIIYDEIKIIDIENKLSGEIKMSYQTILNKNLITLIEEMILNADINARIRGDYLIFIKKDLIIKPEQQTFQHIKDILILRGGDWKIENKQSVFSYKVKVKNNSEFVLTNIQILLTSIPSGLISQSDKYVIDVLNPNSFESPTFKFSANESCV
ncbi:hypothetical protein LCGC14_1382780, partial [marine sediment metagenome]